MVNEASNIQFDLGSVLEAPLLGVEIGSLDANRCLANILEEEGGEADVEGRREIGGDTGLDSGLIELVLDYYLRTIEQLALGVQIGLDKSRGTSMPYFQSLKLLIKSSLTWSK